MANQKPVLYLDTCAILEAHRAGCWRGLVGHFELHTVKECRDELTRGDRKDPAYISIDIKTFDSEVTIHKPQQIHLTKAALSSPTFGGLDKGERDLLAWCSVQDPKALILTTGDRAAIVAACEVGLKDALRSLEEIASKTGSRPKLQNHYREVWLSELRTKWMLDNL